MFYNHRASNSTPCYRCKMRELGCHSVCILYEDYKIDLEILKQKIKDKKVNARSDAYREYANTHYKDYYGEV